MFFYNAFGLNIESDIELEKLIAVEKLQPDITFHYNDFYTVIQSPIIEKKNFQANTTSFAYHIGDTHFYFNFLKKQLFFSHSNKQQFEQYLYGPVVALIAAYNNKLPLHASGVVVQDKAFLIAGNSGSGKSTFLYHLLQNFQARFFADDLVVIGKKDTIINAYPSYAEIKLWLDAVERLRAKIIKPVHPDIKKYFVDVRKLFINKSQIPQAVIILQSTMNKQLKMEKITGVNKYLVLSKNLYRRNHIDQLFRPRVFEQLSTLANQTNVYIVHRPVLIDSSQWDEFVTNFLNQIL